MTRLSCVAYTDGAYKRERQIGGWGYHLSFVDPESQVNFIFYNCGGSRETTNNRMEMTAFLECLKDVPGGCDLKIYSDSEYVLKSLVKDGTGKLTKFTHVEFSGWLKSWMATDPKGTGVWKKSNGKPVENTDLWKEIVWRWVRSPGIAIMAQKAS